MEGFSSQSTLIRYLDFCKDVLSADGILLHLCGKAELDVYRGNSSEMTEEKKESFVRAIEQALERQSPVVFAPYEDSCLSLPKSHLRNTNRRSVLCHPILGMDRPLGVVCLERLSGHEAFSVKNLDFLLELTKPLRHILKSYCKASQRDPAWYFPDTAIVGTSEMHRRVLSMIERV